MSKFANVHGPNVQWLARADREPALEPELPIVDAHTHLWDLNGYRYLVEEFARDVNACGHNVEASIFVECFTMYRTRGPEHLRCIGETEFAVGMSAMAASGKYTKCRAASAIVGFADLTLGPKVHEILEAQVDAANGRFRGVRQRAKWDPDPAVSGGGFNAAGPGLYLDPGLGEGIDVLTSLGLSFDASVYHPQIADVTALARAHPEARIALCHSGSPVGHSSYAGKQAENHANWLASMKELASCPNVSVKLGGLLLHLGLYDFTTAVKPATASQLAELWRPYIEPCIELFGADRCMAQSNFPVEKAGLSYATAWNMLKRITAGCSSDEKRMVYAGTAKRFYRLD